jgi:mRNA interferase MazF
MPTASRTFERYAVHWVALDPARGSELRKTRPAVVVSLDPLNRALETVVVCPLTGQLHPGWRTRLQVKVGGKKSEIAADQIRVVSKARLGRKLSLLSTADAAALRRLLSEMYGDG